MKSLIQFIKNRYKVFFVIFLVIAFIGWLTFDIVENATRPKRTENKSQEEVVQLFYSSINNLDHETMSDCTIKNSGKTLINEVITIFTISQLGGNKIMDAQTWKNLQSSEKNISDMIYGIAELQINKISEQTFEVSYEKWYREFEQGNNASTTNTNELLCTGFYIKEKVYLSQKKNLWAISKIKKISEEKLSN